MMTTIAPIILKIPYMASSNSFSAVLSIDYADLVPVNANRARAIAALLVEGAYHHGSGAMNPREYCRQTCQVLGLSGARAQRQECMGCKLRLDYFMADDPTPGHFERELRLCAQAGLEPALIRAANRLVEAWRSRQNTTAVH